MRRQLPNRLTLQSAIFGQPGRLDGASPGPHYRPFFPAASGTRREVRKTEAVDNGVAV